MSEKPKDNDYKKYKETFRRISMTGHATFDGPVPSRGDLWPITHGKYGTFEAIYLDRKRKIGWRRWRVTFLLSPGELRRWAASLREKGHKDAGRMAEIAESL